uniref:MADF domain-containing protein n=3 Tax=Caenorhabditis japonica TaxID=281687 RepID=A0A8R1DM53_CAEJA
MNSMFQMPVKFTCEDVRSQWKNLKDTFVRKLRWVHEGKYVEDAMKEPTWKFYRMLTFLDEKEAKRLGDAVEHTYELTPAPGSGSLQTCHLKQERSSMLPSASAMMVSYEPTSSEEQMLQMFNQPPVHQQELIEQQIATCSPANGKNVYSPRSQPASSSGVEEEEDEDEQPERKKRFRRPAPAMQPMQVIHSAPLGQDEFDHFGALVAANLRRMCTEQGRLAATRIQRKLSVVLFAED